MSNEEVSLPVTNNSVDSNGGALLSPAGQALQLLRLHFDPTDNVLIRPIEVWTENGKKKSRTLWKQTQCRAATTITESTVDYLNRLGAAERANIFFGVAPRFGGQGYDFAWQIRTVRCLWSDVDRVSSEETIAKCLAVGLPRPSIAVASGTFGGHLYWLLKAPYLIDDVGPPPQVLKEWVEIAGSREPIHYFEDPAGQRVYLQDPTTGRKLGHPELSKKALHLRRILQGIAASIGGDHTIDATRLLRLPGTMNRKDERNGREPRPCRLIECNGERYDIALFERFGEVVVPKKRAAKKPGKPSAAASASRNGHIPSDAEIIKRITESKQGEKFARLMSGDASDYGFDESRADEALCCVLAYWTRDANTIDRIFRTGELCDEKWTSRPDYRSLTISRALELVTTWYDWTGGATKESKATNPVPILLTSSFTLLAVDPRRSPSGKITVTVKLLDGEQPLVRFDITSALSNQKEAARKLGQYIKVAEPSPAVEGEERTDAATAAPSIDLERIIAKIILDAEQQLDDEQAEAAAKAESGEVESVRDIVFREAAPRVALKYRTSDGKAYSERFARPISRTEFIGHTPDSLVRLAKAGFDAEENYTKHLRHVQAALGVLWSTLLDSLPMQAADADLEANSEDARRFSASIVKIWTKTAFYKNVPLTGGSTEVGTVRASAASLIDEAFQPYAKGGRTIGKREKWQQVKTAIPAWWRPVYDDRNRPVPLLAMRFDLSDQAAVSLDGVTDQASLTRLGLKYGVFSDSLGVTARMSGGGRLAILTHEMREQILAKPLDEVDDSAFSDAEADSDSEHGVTDRNSPPEEVRM